MRRKAEIKKQRHRDLTEGQLKLQESRRALESGDILVAKNLAQEAKEAFWRAHNKAMDEQVDQIERDIEAAELEQQRLEQEKQRAIAQVRAAEAAWRRATEELEGRRDVEEVERMLREARHAISQLRQIPLGFSIKDLQMHLDEADEQLAALKSTRHGEELVLQAQAALDAGDMQGAALALDAARAAFDEYGPQHPMALEGVSALRHMQSEYERVERRLEFERQAVLDEQAGDEALEEALIIWEDTRDADRAAELFAKASALYKKALNFEKEDRVIRAEAQFRAEEEEERLQREREEAFKAAQLLEAEGLVARARMFVDDEMLEDARELLTRAAEAYKLLGIGEPAQQTFYEVESYLNFAEQERRRKEEEEAATREYFKIQGDDYLAKARGVLESGSNDFDEARGYAKEAGSAYREAGLSEMEEQVLELIQLISDREDVVVKKLMETERNKREQKLLEEQKRREEAEIAKCKQMEEAAAVAAAEAEARRQAAAAAEELWQKEQVESEQRRKELELEMLRQQVQMRKTEEKAKMDQLAKSAQRMVESAMMAVETGDWEAARSKIASAKEMLARAGLNDSDVSGSPDPESTHKVKHLSDMVKSVSEQLEAAAASAQRIDLENRLHAAQDDAEAAMAQGDWTRARKHLADANDLAVQLNDTDLQQDLHRMRRTVDNAQDCAESEAREAEAREAVAREAEERETKARENKARDEAAAAAVAMEAVARKAAEEEAAAHEAEHVHFEQKRTAQAVREAPLLPPSGADMGYGMSHVSSPPKAMDGAPAPHTLEASTVPSQGMISPILSQPPMNITPSPQPGLLDPYALPPLMNEHEAKGGGVVIGGVGVIGRPALPGMDFNGAWQEELEPLSPLDRSAQSWGIVDPMQEQDDGLIKVSTMGYDQDRMPSDNISHWKESKTAGLPLDFDGSMESEDGMEGVTGGLLGGAMHGLASLNSNSRRTSAFLVSMNPSLSEQDVKRILDVGKRYQQAGSYSIEGEDGLMVYAP